MHQESREIRLQDDSYANDLDSNQSRFEQNDRKFQEDFRKNKNLLKNKEEGMDTKANSAYK